MTEHMNNVVRYITNYIVTCQRIAQREYYTNRYVYASGQGLIGISGSQSS